MATCDAPALQTNPIDPTGATDPTNQINTPGPAENPERAGKRAAADALAASPAADPAAGDSTAVREGKRRVEEDDAVRFERHARSVILAILDGDVTATGNLVGAPPASKDVAPSQITLQARSALQRTKPALDVALRGVGFVREDAADGAAYVSREASSERVAPFVSAALEASLISHARIVMEQFAQDSLRDPRGRDLSKVLQRELATSHAPSLARLRKMRIGAVRHPLPKTWDMLVPRVEEAIASDNVIDMLYFLYDYHTNVRGWSTQRMWSTRGASSDTYLIGGERSNFMSAIVPLQSDFRARVKNRLSGVAVSKTPWVGR